MAKSTTTDEYEYNLQMRNGHHNHVNMARKRVKQSAKTRKLHQALAIKTPKAGKFD